MNRYQKELLQSVLLLLGLILIAIATPWLVARDQGMGRTLQRLLDNGASDQDRDARTEGYYESLIGRTGPKQSAGQGLLEGLSPNQPPRKRETLDGIDAVNGHPFLYWRLKRGLRLTFKGAPFLTNSFGQRDLEYQEAKPHGVFRIALVGSSLSMGSGVAMEASYEALLENQLNLDLGASEIEKVEVINFSVAGYRLTQQLLVVSEQVAKFEPDLVLLVLNNLAVSKTWSRHLVLLITEGRNLRYPFLEELVETGLVDRRGSEQEVARDLAPLYRRVHLESLEYIQTEVHRMGARLAILKLAPAGSEEMLKSRFGTLDDVLADLSIPVLDLLNTFVGASDPEEYWAQPWDDHFNEEGHRLVFSSLYQELKSHGDLVAGIYAPGGTPSQ